MALHWALLCLIFSPLMPATEYGLPKFICSPMPLDMDNGCQSASQQRHGAGANSAGNGHWVGTLEEAKETILHLRETVVHQKETILDQRETVRELTAKLSRCEAHSRRHGAAAANTMEDPPKETSGVNQMERMLESLKERLEHLQVPSLVHQPPLLQKTIPYLSQLCFLLIFVHLFLVYPNIHHPSLPPIPPSFNVITVNNGRQCSLSLQSEDFRVGFPLRTNYMYVKVKRTLHHEIFAFSICLWLKSSSAPGMGTPFSYSVPGQANEVVLIEWGNNPMELLINDKAATLPLAINDAKWHHICVTWSTRDGIWESYQDGVRRGSGENLAPWHPVKPGGVFVLGQEQDTLGGRFDATQAFIGEISDFNMWGHILTPGEVYKMATCTSYAGGDIINWAEASMELHGGVVKLPFNACH
uniref:Pentraxin (PTX) domain-containing protein n=1 Tax=Podarcis muralis TaxID=64176 RepID=A0A670K070_PODMU